MPCVFSKFKDFVHGEGWVSSLAMLHVSLLQTPRFDFKQMRLRPVFILSEGFCRAHGLPHKRILRPPLFRKNAEVVNYSKLAIRYTTFMTKDMVYGALREVFRGVSDLYCCLVFQTGQQNLPADDADRVKL